MLNFLSKLELPIWFSCNQMDMEVVISIKYGWNTIVWGKNRHLRHFVQNLSGVKVHANCKILKFCRNFGVTKTHVGKVFEIWVFFNLKRQSFRYYQEKNQVGPTLSSYINLVDKIANSPKKQGKVLHFLGSCISVLLQIGSSFQAS